MKTLSGALIPYGSTLPTASTSADGALFYKTDSIGGPQGMYLYSTIADSNSGAIGNQVAQGWVQAASPGLFVLKSGDTMTGALTVPSFLRLTETSGAQRLLIGNQDLGGANKPSIIQGQNGVLSIGSGSTWAGNGGTLLAGLSIDPSSATGLTFQGGQVWHSGNDGAATGLDADLLDGQQGSFYQNATNLATGIVATARGGTGASLTPAAGSILYSTSGTAFAAVAGTVGQLLVSGGAAAPTWSDTSTITVGTATFATSAGSAATAGTATTATTALSVPWTGISGLPAASQALSTAGFPAVARPSLFYDMGSAGTLSMTPTQFQVSSLSGFDSGATSDLGLSQVGITITGTVTSNAVQLVGNFDLASTTNGPAGGLRYRASSFTGTSGQWGQFSTLWDSGNFNPANYVAKSGDQMTGGLAVGAIAVPAAGSVSITGNFQANGNVTAYASDGRLKMNISPIQNAVEKVVSLGGYEYDWNMIKCDEHGFKPEHEHEHGLIAQEVQKVLPDAVAPAPFDNRFLTVRYDRVVALLTAAIGEQQKQIEALLAKVEALESK